MSALRFDHSHSRDMQRVFPSKRYKHEHAFRDIE